MIATWFVMEDGSVCDPSGVKADAEGVLRASDGRAVAMRGDVPRSRSIDTSAHREMRPQQSGGGYVTRGAGAFDHDGDGQPGGSAKPSDAEGGLAALRAEYQQVVGKRPFAGWDAATLQEKIAAARKAD